MITLIVPTRDRAHTLRLVAPSYFVLDGVSEVIFVIDGGSDTTPQVLERIAASHPTVRTRILHHPTRQGAAQSRNTGVAASTNDYILFCDDDEYLEAGYARTCLQKLQTSGVGAVSGRRVYMENGETPAGALRRFGHGLRPGQPFRPLICEYVNGARFAGDIRLPLTNAVILTSKQLLLRFPYDPHYAHGNGYREESDFQMNLYTHGYDIVASNDCHSIHLPPALVRTGGQRTQTFRRIYWSIYYTHYFFGKYYAAYAARAGLHAPRWLAEAAFAVFAVYRETLRPPLYALAKWGLRQRRRWVERTISA
ncbi:glycosyltransferase family 2 protein [Ferribacterium limneticum]|uniref:glycosyltransferase family 2 protein n=1 Tax=Ferribacterium limneticum TaxID=76259 RepID=UPI001CF846BB|nr:glycosyltransferase family 2 protein [Ferribacterium limneticum]UCV24546.1 glycosyltransferase family 2 protein [Ferribacterium limneticum]